MAIPLHNAENSRTKYWCFTHTATNNIKGQYEDKWPNALMELKTQRSIYKITFLVYQEERGHGDAKEENEELRGKYHIQGYLELDKEINFTSIKALFSQRIHWEKRFGTAEQAEDYCSKADTRVEDGLVGKFGERSTTKQGQRTDLDACTKIINDPTVKNKKRKLAEECGSAVVKYSKGLETYAQWKGVDLEEKRGNLEREVYIIWGAAGCGKTMMAWKLMDVPNSTYYVPQSNNSGALSFESYNGEDWILLDEFNPGSISLDALKRLMDRYDCALPGRGSGSSRNGQHRGVIITSQHNPAEFVGQTNNPEHLVALKRRCKEIIHVQRDGWTFENSKRTLPPQMPKLEAWARSRGIWQDKTAQKSAMDAFWDELEQDGAAQALYQEAQEDVDSVEPTQVVDYSADFAEAVPRLIKSKEVINLTDSDDED